MTAAQQHRYEAGAARLLYLAFAISLVGDGVFRCGYFAAHPTPRDYFLLYVANPFLLYLYYQIQKGVAGVKQLVLGLYTLFLLELAHASYDTPLEFTSLLYRHLRNSFWRPAIVRSIFLHWLTVRWRGADTTTYYLPWAGARAILLL